MSSAPFTWPHRVTYSDCTAGNHVYYGRFLAILEEARGELFRAAGMPFLQLQEQDTIFPVVECRLRYKTPAPYDELLTVAVWVTAAEGVRLQFRYRVSNSRGRLVVEAETMHACTSVSGRLKRLPETVRHACQPFLPAEAPGAPI